MSMTWIPITVLLKFLSTSSPVENTIATSASPIFATELTVSACNNLTLKRNGKGGKRNTIFDLWY